MKSRRAAGELGTFFGFQATSLAGDWPEYLCLSKALGGGLVKIGATLIRRDIYEQDFGILHTSTFGEDELSAAPPRGSWISSPGRTPIGCVGSGTWARRSCGNSRACARSIPT